MEKLKPYAKLIVAIIGALAVTLSQFINDPTVQLVCTIVLSVLTAAGVYQVPNKPAITNQPRVDSINKQ